MIQHPVETTTTTANTTSPLSAARSPILQEADDYLCSRKEAAELLTALGLKTSPATLATWFTRRTDGPPVQHFSRFAKYQVGALRQWAAAQLSKPRRSSSEPKEQI